MGKGTVMFDYLNGYIADKRKTQKGAYITVEVGGIGYLAEVTDRDFCEITGTDEKLKIYISLLHREDAMTLFGFRNKETRDIFNILMSVSGVGAKMAVALLNEFDACDLISLVIDGNYKELTRAKGVGPKLAQKIILELQDKLIKTDLPKTQTATYVQSQAIIDAQAVLASLGYEESEISDTFKKIMPAIADLSSPEEVLRKALTNLSV